MLVYTKGDKLRIEVYNDLEFFKKEISKQVLHFQDCKSLSTKISITIFMDGRVVDKVAPIPDESKKSDITSLAKKMKLRQDAIELADVRITRTFSLQVKLEFEYVLSDVSGQTIIDDIGNRLRELKTLGFVVKEPQFAD